MIIVINRQIKHIYDLHVLIVRIILTIRTWLIGILSGKKLKFFGSITYETLMEYLNLISTTQKITLSVT